MTGLPTSRRHLEFVWSSSWTPQFDICEPVPPNPQGNIPARDRRRRAYSTVVESIARPSAAWRPLGPDLARSKRCLVDRRMFLIGCSISGIWYGFVCSHFCQSFCRSAGSAGCSVPSTQPRTRPIFSSFHPILPFGSPFRPPLCFPLPGATISRIEASPLFLPC